MDMVFIIKFHLCFNKKIFKIFIVLKVKISSNLPLKNFLRYCILAKINAINPRNAPIFKNKLIFLKLSFCISL